MKTAYAQLAKSQIPRDDGAIARALLELESKLTAWAAAVANVQQKVAESVTRCGTGDAGNAAPDAANASERTTCPERTQSTVGHASHAVQEAAPEKKQPSKQPREGGKRRNPIHKSATDESMEDVDALLCLLEPEMANAIRVQHRLFAGRKSVQELIDSYEPAPRNGKKSWW